MKANRAGFNLTLLISLLAVAACAPRLQGLGPAAKTGFIEPRIEVDAFVTRDDLRLGLSRWEAEDPHAILIAAHGMNDYGNAFAADFLASAGATCSEEDAGVPCILGSGGGVVIRGGYRSPGPWYIGGAYQFTKTDSANLPRTVPPSHSSASKRGPWEDRPSASS